MEGKTSVLMSLPTELLVRLDEWLLRKNGRFVHGARTSEIRKIVGEGVAKRERAETVRSSAIAPGRR